MLSIYDTALATVTELDLREPGRVSIYSCGPTVYDVPHIGHGRQALVYDLLWRYLEWSGLEVDFVSNVTDIDDNIIKRAAQEGRSSEAVALHYEAEWWDAMDRLGVRRPVHVPHATAYVEQMVELVAELESRGFAYDAPDSVYFASEKVEDYGLLAQQPLDSLRAGARVEAGEGKRAPVDFALWKKARPGEPAWPSPWGEGRPGWHTECVVMSLDLLGEGFDLHTGGLDLKFPHHENERSQAVALGRRFSRHWMHHAFVEVEGEKMSKSLHNFTSLTDLLSRHDGRAYRLLVLQSHYRSPMEVTPQTVERAERSLGGLDAFARRLASAPLGASASSPSPDPETMDRFRQRMDHDLDTPGAVAVLFDAVSGANRALDASDMPTAAPLARAVEEMAGAVGLQLRGGEERIDAEAAELVRRRDEARRARDFAAADVLRDALVARGWAVEDTPGGTKLHR